MIARTEPQSQAGPRQVRLGWKEQRAGLEPRGSCSPSQPISLTPYTTDKMENDRVSVMPIDIAPTTTPNNDCDYGDDNINDEIGGQRR